MSLSDKGNTLGMTITIYLPEVVNFIFNPSILLNISVSL